MIRSRYLPLAVFLTSAFVISCDSTAAQDGEATPEESRSVEAEAMPHPFGVPALRARSYDAGTIELLQNVSDRDGLEGWTFSYDSDGLRQYGLLEKPAGAAPQGGWPVIVLTHGYIPPDQYDTVRNYRLVTRYYASGGFMVIKPDYRGHGNSEGSPGRPGRTSEYATDVLNLLAGLDQFEDANLDQVFFYGHSMGGEIGLYVLEVTDRVKGATIWAAVTEPFPENYLYFVRKRSVAQAEALRAEVARYADEEDYAEITPLTYLEDIEVPLLVHHGTEDESVPFEWSVPFRMALDEAGVDYTFYAYPGEDHNISQSFYRVMDRDMAFFRRLMEE